MGSSSVDPSTSVSVPASLAASDVDDTEYELADRRYSSTGRTGEGVRLRGDSMLPCNSGFSCARRPSTAAKYARGPMGGRSFGSRRAGDCGRYGAMETSDDICVCLTRAFVKYCSSLFDIRKRKSFKYKNWCSNWLSSDNGKPPTC